MRKIQECPRCQGSGEIGIHITLLFERAGPVPEDSKSYHATTCPDCHGAGCVEDEEK